MPLLMTRDSAKEPPRTGAADARRQRLAAELRANLKRRKVQARARRAAAPKEDDRPGDTEMPE